MMNWSHTTMKEPFAKRAQKQVIKVSEIRAEKMATQARLPFQRPEFKPRYTQGNSQLLIIQSPGDLKSSSP